MKKRTAGKTMLLAALLTLACAGLLGIWLYHTWEKIPASIRIKAGVEQELSLGVPGAGEVFSADAKEKEKAVMATGIVAGTETESLPIDLSRPVTMIANQTQHYKMNVKLFGVIPFKTVDVQVIPDEMLIPAGIPIGIYVRTDGILVIDQGSFEGRDHGKKEPARHLLKAGDYILKADGEEVKTKAQLTEKIAETDGKEMVLTLRRQEEVFEVKVKPEQDVNGAYKLGIWIRDNAQGVGTMTYLQPDCSFGALGHGINDTDTAALMEVKSGSLYKTEIVAVKKGQDGTPGELTGIIDYNPNNKIGSIEVNSVEGIFGSLKEELAAQITKEAIPIGLKQDVRKGEAQILCCVDGEKVPQLYDIEIQEIHLDHDNVNRGLELLVTDEQLLEKTGGIVQGMSGSPIIQEGKLIGAVTHVLVNDPKRGYGIFIENMLQQ